MSLLPEKNPNVTIIGCCVLRDIFGFVPDCPIKVDRFVLGYPPAALGAPPFIAKPWQKIKEKLNQTTLKNFWRKTFALLLTNSAFDYAFAGELSRYCLVDMSVARFHLLTNAKGACVPHSEQILDLLNFLDVKGPFSTISDTNTLLRILDLKIAAYCAEIKKHYAPEKIILFQIKSSTLACGNNFESFDNRNIEQKNTLMLYAFEKAKDYLQNCHVVEFPKYMMSNSAHKWGKDDLHYMDEFYQYGYEACQIIFAGAANNMPLNEEKQLLFDLKQKYQNKCYKKFIQNLMEPHEVLINLKTVLKYMNMDKLARIDIINENSGIDLAITPADIKIIKQEDSTNGSCRYVCAAASYDEILINIACKKSGLIQINLSCIECGYKDKQIPLCANYKSMEINNEIIFNHETVSSWEKPFIYEKTIEKGRVYSIKIILDRHEYSGAEYKNILNCFFA